MEKILQQILSELKDVRTELKDVKTELKEVKSDVTELKKGQIRIENKLESVYEHTAKISDDITETNMKIDEVIDDIDYLKHKEHKTEEDLYKLKKNLKIVK